VEIGKAVLSNAKIRDVLGWKPVHDFEDALRKTFDYFKGRLGEYL
jgi:nucleoside-diphosphate-sugar epimerase